MICDPEQLARIIESKVVGDGGSSDSGLCGLAAGVRTMEFDRVKVALWVISYGRLKGVDGVSLQAIVDAILSNAAAV